jgi:hypothetical protein
MPSERDGQGARLRSLKASVDTIRSLAETHESLLSSVDIRGLRSDVSQLKETFDGMRETLAEFTGLVRPGHK